MQFALTDEQQMIRDTAAGFLADKSDSGAVRTAMASGDGFDASLWKSICEEMVWPAIHIPEAYGGLGLSYVDVAVVMEQMGKRLLCAPYFSTVAMGANALLCCGSEAQKAHWLARIVEGETATLAYHGGGRDWSSAATSAEYTVSDDTFVLNGDYHYVVDGHSAALLIVAAKPADSGDISLFILPTDSAGLSRQWTPTMDQTRRLAKVQLNNVSVPAENRLSGESDSATGACLQDILDLATIALAAEQCGGAAAILEQSVAYTQEREQFGRKVAGFQSLKHKAADMKLKSEVSRSAVYYAACVAQEFLAGVDGDPTVAAQLSEAASMAKAYCSDSYFFNAGSGLQMHGGVGFTWEYDVHLYFKRAKSSETLFGDGSWHRERIATQLLDDSMAEVSAR